VETIPNGQWDCWNGSFEFFLGVNLSKLTCNNVIGLCLGAKNIKLSANDILRIGTFNFLKICFSELGLAFCMQTICNYYCKSKDMQGSVLWRHVFRHARECASIQFWLIFSKFMWGMQVAEENCAQMHMAAGVWEKDLQQTSVGFNTIGVAPIQGRPCVWPMF